MTENAPPERTPRSSSTSRGVVLAVAMGLVPAIALAGVVLSLNHASTDDDAFVAPPFPTPSSGLQEDRSGSPRKHAKPARPSHRAKPDAPRARKPGNALNLPRSVIVQLGQVADLYGYGLGPGTALSYHQSLNFAYGLSVVCDEVRSGRSTFQDSIQDDISMGAPASDARGFNRYLQQTFCPAYYAAGN